MSTTATTSPLTANHYPLIIECCALYPNTQKLESLCSQIIDWNGLLTSAYAHGVYPLVAKSLKSISSVPEHIKSVLKITNLDIARRNMMMTSEMLRIMKLLEENGIQALAIKGPVLSQIIHGDVATRQYADIDILVKPEELYHATEVLSKNEYIYEYDLAFTKNKALWKATKDLTLTNSKNNLSLELHWRLFSGRLFKKSDTEYLASNRQLMHINNQVISTIDARVLLLYLLLHGSKHVWERIEWIVDIDRLVRESNVDWNFIWDLSEQMDIVPMVQLGCAVCYDLFATPFDEALLKRIDTPMIQKAKDTVISKIKNDEIFGENQIMNTVYYLGLGNDNKWYEYFFRSLRYAKEDVYTINLPSKISFLYHLIHLYNSAKYRLKTIL